MFRELTLVGGGKLAPGGFYPISEMEQQSPELRGVGEGSTWESGGKRPPAGLGHLRLERDREHIFQASQA